jgi:hypothetical protein
MTIIERARSVRTREDFLAFLEAFFADYEVNGLDWENNDLGSFLEAMSGWGRDMDGFYANMGEDPAQISPWQMVADLLIAARVYE